MRDGLERILRGRTGALVVLGDNDVIGEISTGGFALDVPFTPTALRELAKMDGAIVLSERPGAHRARRRAPDARPVDRDLRDRDPAPDRRAGRPPVRAAGRHRSPPRWRPSRCSWATSATWSSTPSQILSRAEQALQTLERYRGRLTQVIARLSSLEVQDAVTVRDVALVAQRLEMVRPARGGDRELRPRARHRRPAADPAALRAGGRLRPAARAARARLPARTTTPTSP